MKEVLKQNIKAILFVIFFFMCCFFLSYEYVKSFSYCQKSINECNQKEIIKQCKLVKTDIEISNILTTCK